MASLGVAAPGLNGGVTGDARSRGDILMVCCGYDCGQIEEGQVYDRRLKIEYSKSWFGFFKIQNLVLTSFAGLRPRLAITDLKREDPFTLTMRSSWHLGDLKSRGLYVPALLHA